MSVTWTGGAEHWTHKGNIKLFLWHKKASPKVAHAGTIFFVHGSSMASQPTFDLQVPGRPYSSAMDWFRARVNEMGGGNYQTLINDALRQHISQQREPWEDTLRRVFREEIQRSA